MAVLSGEVQTGGKNAVRGIGPDEGYAACAWAFNSGRAHGMGPSTAEAVACGNVGNVRFRCNCEDSGSKGLTGEMFRIIIMP